MTAAPGPADSPSRDAVGASPARVGGRDRVTGRQAYTADIHLEDALHVKLVTLPCARARIGAPRSQPRPAGR